MQHRRRLLEHDLQWRDGLDSGHLRLHAANRGELRRQRPEQRVRRHAQLAVRLESGLLSQCLLHHQQLPRGQQRRCVWLGLESVWRQQHLRVHGGLSNLRRGDAWRVWLQAEDAG